MSIELKCSNCLNDNTINIDIDRRMIWCEECGEHDQILFKEYEELEREEE